MMLRRTSPKSGSREYSLPVYDATPPEALDFDNRDAVFDLPATAIAPGQAAVVALRVLYPPSSRDPAYPASWNISVDESRVTPPARLVGSAASVARQPCIRFRIPSSGSER